MSNEILVNINPQETRVALVEHGVLQEVYIQRSSRQGVVGNIYMGRVERVLPGMQAAFVEIGLERTAFLHASDIEPPAEGEDERPIRELVREGQQLLVQVIKEPLGSKGARLTTQLTIPSRFLVLVPESAHVGISTKIEDEEERARLKACVSGLMEDADDGCGFIVRTAGEGVDCDSLAADVSFLRKLWRSVQDSAADAQRGTLVHGDLPLAMRILRDLLGTDVERVRIDDADGFRRCQEFARRFVTETVDRIELYDSPAPIFDLYGVEDELQRALDRKVPLKSGGHLVFDQTEAMTTVDVNTGAFVGYRNLEETIFKTNLEAAQTIARQLRLRNLGGIIIIDFIDMAEPGHREQVIQALDKAMARDNVKTSICEMSALGLVEMTRKRTRDSLERILCEPCPTCSGRGTVKTAETVCYEIFRELRRTARQFNAGEFRVLAHPDVIARLQDEQATSLAELEEFVHKPIRLMAEAQYLPESYDVVPI